MALRILQVYLLCINIRLAYCGSTNGKIIQPIHNFEIKDLQDYHIIDSNQSEQICILECLRDFRCTDASWEQRTGRCKLHSVSLFDMGFNGEIIANTSWKILHLQKQEHSWIPIAKFSTSTGLFNGSDSWELWSNPNISVNADSCASLDGSVPCTRHFVHKYKDWILGLDTVTKVKVSLYDNGEEVAWAIFRKLPVSEDNWFQPSRVIDSSPWDPELLRQTTTTEMSLEPQPGNEGIRFYIVEKHTNREFTQWTAFRYWMKIREPGSWWTYGKSPSPQILYSLDPGPVMLTNSSVSYFRGWSGRYSLNWAQAQTFCDTNLGVPIATYDDVDNARVTEDYDTCAAGWMSPQVAGYPRNTLVSNCGNKVGMVIYVDPTPVERQYDVYCKTNQSLVGVADTMVISVLI